MKNKLDIIFADAQYLNQKIQFFKASQDTVFH